LIGRLAELDDAWQAGTVDAASYQARRAEWKEKLVDLLIAN